MVAYQYFLNMDTKRRKKGKRKQIFELKTEVKILCAKLAVLAAHGLITLKKRVFFL